MAREGDPTALWSCADKYKAVQMAHSLVHVVPVRAPRGGPTALMSWRDKGKAVQIANSLGSMRPSPDATKRSSRRAKRSCTSPSPRQERQLILVASLCLAVPDGSQRVLEAVPLLAEKPSECRVKPLHLKVT